MKAAAIRKPRTIRILIFGDEKKGAWAAQCLDCDMAMQAKSFKGLIYEVNRVLNGHLLVSEELGIDPFETLRPAPPAYHQLFDQAKFKFSREVMPFSPDHTRSLGLSRVEGRMVDLQPAFC